ncbi:MAG: hypothetical protein HYT37_02880 [Candidatus Sungbacteria bacterium]|nr:hypothetical protein [Candidatus Sungbacteria bacterium]
MQYIITNFVYGTGPYLRTTELAIAINNEFDGRGKEKMGIIVPWVYGEKQKRIMLEEFESYEEKNPGLILLDPMLGATLQKVFYGEKSYEEALRIFVEQFDMLSKEEHEHLSRNFDVFDLQGNKHTVRSADIAFEINRAPRICYNIAPAYSVTFGYVSEILQSVLDVPQETVALDRALVKQAIAIAEKIEASHVFHALAHPGTFSFKKDRMPRFSDEILIPPTIANILPNIGKITEGVYPVKNSVQTETSEISNGIYVTITGIPGLERLYEETRKLGLKLYSNDTKAIPGSEYLSPHYISNQNIKLQFARSGWGSVWLSQLSGTPFVAPNFDPKDDPEIYFNNKCIEKLGLGVIYRGQSLAEIIREAEKLKARIQNFNHKLLEQFGTLNGNEYAAKKIVENV